jgi:hypothetical protein
MGDEAIGRSAGAVEKGNPAGEALAAVKPVVEIDLRRRPPDKLPALLDRVASANRAPRNECDQGNEVYSCLTDNPDNAVALSKGLLWHLVLYRVTASTVDSSGPTARLPQRPST